MKLIIMRHGQAESFRVEDTARSLTEFGEHQVELAGTWLASYFGESTPIDLALVSYYARAEQTYEHLSQKIAISAKQVSKDVIPDADPTVAHSYLNVLLEEQPQLKSVVIVSHMPFVSYFLEEVHIDRQAMLFDTSSIVIIDYDIHLGKGVIENIYHPE